MTAPDSRDSVELDGGWTSEDRLIQGLRNDGYDEAADLIESLQFRLQALARGPQRAGGGAAKWTPEEVARQLAERPNQPHYIAALVRKAIAHETAALQAEVARLQRERDIYKADHHQALTRAEAAEAALREAQRDAERYRWLRRRNELTGADDPRGPFAIETNADDMIGHPNAADLDAAIDAALNGGQDDA